MRDEKGFLEVADRAADLLLGAGGVTVVAHIDADGVSSAAIATASLDRAGVPNDVRFVKKIDPTEIDRINADTADVVWLVDLGSGSFSAFTRPNMVITDHHVPDTDSPSRKGGQLDLFSFEDTHVNPHLYGIDGATEVSGSGVTYTVAKAMDPGNIDLAPVAMVGANGDFQDSAACRMVGWNRRIIADGEADGGLEAREDVRIYGRETRPLVQWLQFSNDPMLPGLTGNADGCARFLRELDIELRSEERWRCYVDLEGDERAALVDGLLSHLEGRGRPTKRLTGEVYELIRERRGTELHDAKEYSTMLNACGRYGKAAIGMAICRGDRGDALNEGVALQRNHRSNLANGIEMIKGQVERRRFLQFFHAGDRVQDSIVGIVAGMVLASGSVGTDLPMVAFADSEDEAPDGSTVENVKVSTRGTRDLVVRGLDLAHAVAVSSSLVGGSGGGHNIAAGATIPKGKEEEFMAMMEDIIASQII